TGRVANSPSPFSRPLRKASDESSGRATPIIEKDSPKSPPAARLYSAGTNRRRVRSPDAPKITSVQGSAGRADARAFELTNSVSAVIDIVTSKDRLRGD